VDQWRGHIYRLAVHPITGVAASPAHGGRNRATVADRGAARIYALTYTEDGAAFWASLPYNERVTRRSSEPSGRSRPTLRAQVRIMARIKRLSYRTGS